MEPPSLVLVYKMWGRLRLRRMPIRNLWPNASTKFILEDIRARHELLLGVPDELICRMIEILKASKGGIDLNDAVANLAKLPQIKIDSVLDQNDNESTKHRLSLEQKETPPESNAKPERPISLNVIPKNIGDKTDKPYSFMDKRIADEDTDFDANDDLPLDDHEGNSDDDFWR
ncbi:Hypothetical protein NTJ_05496 [Nesidiocoris tenuis]|nr:Hypothetical protein NTJ_05496 [Nesidiocoris tenuis]